MKGSATAQLAGWQAGRASNSKLIIIQRAGAGVGYWRHASLGRFPLKTKAQARLRHHHQIRRRTPAHRVGHGMQSRTKPDRDLVARHPVRQLRLIEQRSIGDMASGVGYLRKMLDVSLFPEIWKLRTSL